MRQPKFFLMIFWTTVILATIALGWFPSLQAESTNSAVIKSASAVQSNKIVVTNYALAYVTRRIAGDKFTVIYPFETQHNASDPALLNWKSDRVQKEFQTARAIFSTHAALEPWINFSSFKDKLIETLADPSESVALAINDHATLDHFKEAKVPPPHRFDPYLWLDPIFMLDEIQVILKEMIKLDPGGAAYYHQRAVTLQTELRGLHEALKRGAAALLKKPLLAAHPYYNYLAARYRLNVKNVHLDLASTPAEEESKELIRLLKSHPATWIIWPTQPSYPVSAKFHDLGIRVIVLNPGFGPNGAENYLDNMYELAEQMQQMDGTLDTQ
jgi:zinc transport system substrate-binding protein